MGCIRFVEGVTFAAAAGTFGVLRVGHLNLPLHLLGQELVRYSIVVVEGFQCNAVGVAAFVEPIGREGHSTDG